MIEEIKKEKNEIKNEESGELKNSNSSNEEKKYISKENLDEIKSMNKTIVNIRDAIGDLELRKQELFMQYGFVRKNMNQKLEAAIIEAGADPSQMKKYELSFETGEFKIK